MLNDTQMLEPLEVQTSNQLTLFVADSPVRMSALPDAGRGWLESEADYGTSFIELFQRLNQEPSLLRTSLVCYPVTTEKILPSSFTGWSSAGMASRGGYLTLDISESPSDAVECSLSQVLEADAPPKYYLSAKACQGILRRADKRGKELPRLLGQALEQVAQETNGMK